MSEQVDALAPVLAAEFEAHEVLHFEGRGGRTFDYIEDETVMDRADAVLGLGATSWAFTVITDACVRGSLDVRWPDGTASHYEDFGYATRTDSAEPLKEAVSDAIRRLGRYIGIFRYGYHKHSPSGNGRAVPSPARPSAAYDDDPDLDVREFRQKAAVMSRGLPRTDDPYADLPNEWETNGKPTADAGDDYCPEHHIRWTLKPAGTSKAGKAYDAFWKCDGKPDGEFCKAKPSKAWQARHEG